METCGEGPVGQGGEVVVRVGRRGVVVVRGELQQERKPAVVVIRWTGLAPWGFVVI